MAFPTYGEEVPTLSSYQLSFQAYTFGAGTALEIKEIEGADLPNVRSGDAGRPRDHGLFRGLDLLAGREVTIKGDIRKDSTSFQHALNAYATITVPTGTTEFPLYASFPGYGTLATSARIRKSTSPLNIRRTLGELAEVAMLFASSDPRWYATPTQQATAIPPSTIAGFSFPLAFPLSFGGGTQAGAVAITNAGNIETRPILIVEGPCVNPSMTNASAPNSPTLAFNITLNSGDKLEIDTDLHSVLYFASGSTIAADRASTIAAGSQWWTLEAAKTSTIQYLSSNGEGKLIVQWASAYLIA